MNLQHTCRAIAWLFSSNTFSLLCWSGTIQPAYHGDRCPPHSFVILSHDSWALNQNFCAVDHLRALSTGSTPTYVEARYCFFISPFAGNDAVFCVQLTVYTPLTFLFCPFSKDKAQFYQNIQFLLLKLLPLLACTAVYGNWTHCQWTMCSSYFSVRYPLVERQCFHRC